jgi:hypothetical protein
MGTSTLPKIAAPPTLVPATSDQYNSIVDALQGHKVMRDSAGNVEDNVSDIGRATSGRPKYVHVGTGITVGGKLLNVSNYLTVIGILSGAVDSEEYPDFLSAGITTRKVTVKGASTSLSVMIDSQIYSLEADIDSGDLPLAPSTNNTCIVSGAYGEWWRTTIGEFGNYITVGAIGSEITSLDGTIQVFKINNGVDDEIFIAEIDGTKIIPIRRGIAGTTRITYSTGDTITLLKASYIFLDNDLATVDYTNNFPTWAATAPSSPTSGDYYFNVSEKKWYKYNGTTWEALGRIFLGTAICDYQYCLYADHEHFSYDWDGLLSFNSVQILSATQFKIVAPITINVAGSIIEFESDVTLDMTTDLESGVTESASKWYYVYVSKTGVFKLSDKAPRRLDKRYGYYHPEKYWRAISVVFNDSGSNLLYTTHSYNSNKISINHSSISTNEIMFPSVSGNQSAYLPVIVDTIQLLVYCNYTDTQVPTLTLTEWSNTGNDVRMIALDEQVAHSTPSTILREVTKHFELNFVRNSILGINLGVGNIYISVTGLTIKF